MHIENSRVKGTLIIRGIGGSKGGAASLNIVKSEEKKKKTDKDSKLIYLFDYCVCIC